MRILGRATVVAIFLGPVFAPLLAAQPSDEAQRPQVLILASYHFAGSNRNIIKTEVADVLSPAKQLEVESVIESLSRFRPTRVAVEFDFAEAARLDSLYDAYRASRHTLSRSESQQLGFRLAARFRHPRVHGIDVLEEDLPFMSVMEYAQEHDSSFMAFVDRERARHTEEASRLQEQLTIGEILRRSNEPDDLAADHAVYMRFSRVGAGDTYVGAELVAKWYRRNIKVFSNIQRIAEPGDRIVVIYGSGHAPILRQLVDDDPALDLVEATSYLPAGQSAGAGGRK